MFLISCNKTYGLTRKSDFEKRFIIRIRKRTGQRGRRNSPAAIHNIIEKRGDLFLFKSKPPASQNFVVL